MHSLSHDIGVPKRHIFYYVYFCVLKEHRRLGFTTISRATTLSFPELVVTVRQERKYKETKTAAHYLNKRKTLRAKRDRKNIAVLFVRKLCRLSQLLLGLQTNIKGDT